MTKNVYVIILREKSENDSTLGFVENEYLVVKDTEKMIKFDLGHERHGRILKKNMDTIRVNEEKGVNFIFYKVTTTDKEKISKYKEQMIQHVQERVKRTEELLEQRKKEVEFLLKTV